MSESSFVVAAVSGQTAAVNSTFVLFLVCLIRGWIGDLMRCANSEMCLQLMANTDLSSGAPGIDTSCWSVKSSKVSLGTFTWSPFVDDSDPPQPQPPTPRAIAAPLPPPRLAPMIDPNTAPPAVLFASARPARTCRSIHILPSPPAPFALHHNPVSSSRVCDLPVNSLTPWTPPVAVDVGGLGNHYLTVDHKRFFKAKPGNASPTWVSSGIDAIDEFAQKYACAAGWWTSIGAFMRHGLPSPVRPKGEPPCRDGIAVACLRIKLQRNDVHQFVFCIQTGDLWKLISLSVHLGTCPQSCCHSLAPKNAQRNRSPGSSAMTNPHSVEVQHDFSLTRPLQVPKMESIPRPRSRNSLLAHRHRTPARFRGQTV